MQTRSSPCVYDTTLAKRYGIVACFAAVIPQLYSKTTGFGEYSLNESCPSCEFWRQALILRFSMGFELFDSFLQAVDAGEQMHQSGDQQRQNR